MGGVGSGRRWVHRTKETTEDYRSIDVRRWNREGLLNPHQSFAWQWSLNGQVRASIRVRTLPERVILNYRYRRPGQDWQSEYYPVCLDWTACPLGGKRPWFLCPADGCGKRVAILYSGGIFACRHCLDLAYPSQREKDFDRLARRADSKRAKLGWETGLLNNPIRRKPKGMHWRTFQRLIAEHDRLANGALRGIAAHMGFLEDFEENRRKATTEN